MLHIRGVCMFLSDGHFLSLTVSMSPQRVADAANPHPYPFVVRQERLPPDDRERNGKPRKPKLRPRADRNTRQEEGIRFNTGPRNLRGAPVNRGGRRPFRMLGRYGYDDHTGTVLHPKLIYLPLASFTRHPGLSTAIVPRGDVISSTLSMLQHNIISSRINTSSADSGGNS
jgi:hypothetical protein